MIKLINILNEMEIEDPGTGIVVRKNNTMPNKFDLYLNETLIDTMLSVGKKTVMMVFSNEKDVYMSRYHIIKDHLDQHGIPYKEDIARGKGDTFAISLIISIDAIDNWDERDSLNEMEIQDPNTGLTIKKSKYSNYRFDLYLYETFIDTIGYHYDTNEQNTVTLLFPNQNLHMSRYRMIKDHLDQYDIPYKEDTVSTSRAIYTALTIPTDAIDNWGEKDSLNEMEIDDPSSTGLTLSQPDLDYIKNTSYYYYLYLHSTLLGIVVSFDGNDDYVYTIGNSSKIIEALEDNGIPYKQIDYNEIAIPVDYIDNIDSIRNKTLNEMEIDDPHGRVSVTRSPDRAFDNYIQYYFNIEDLIPGISHINEIIATLRFRHNNTEWTCLMVLYPDNTYFRNDEGDIIMDWVKSYGYRSLNDNRKTIYVHIPIEDAFDIFDIDPKKFRND